MAIIRGTAGDETRSGTTGHDVFQFFQGGTDNLSGDDGNDIFKLGGALSAGDIINGGAGVDRLYLNGDYSGGFTFGDDALVSVEHIRLSGAFDYSLTMADANVTAERKLTIHANHITGGHALTFDGSAETNGRYVIYGSTGADTLTGGARADDFNLANGGADSAYGGGGTDHFTIGTNFGGGAIDGGAGEDVVLLVGDHFGFVFGATTMTNVETLRLGGGYEFTLTNNDATVAAGATLVVDGSAGSSGDDFDFNGGAETDGHFSIIGSASHNFLTGGALSDTFLLNQNNDDTVSAGGGDDTITIGQFTTGHAIDGGTGYDILNITGATGSDSLSVSSTVMSNIEKLVALTNNTVEMSFNDNVIAAGATLEIDGTAATTHSFQIFATGETNGQLVVHSGGQSGSIYTGALSDTIVMSAHTAGYSIGGGGGSDDITLNSGLDSLFFFSASNSSGANRDIVHGFNADVDKFDITVAVGGFDGVQNGTHDISAATFDSDMGSAINDYLIAHHAVVIHATGGDLSGHDFLIVDANGTTTYDTGTDYVMDITGYTGTLDVGDFT